MCTGHKENLTRSHDLQANPRTEWIQSVGRRLNIKKHEDWYSVTKTDLRNIKAYIHLKLHYDSSLYKALVSFYPHLQWHFWKFSDLPDGIWHDLKNQRRFFDWFADEYKMERLEDWYNIKTLEVRRRGGEAVLDMYTRWSHSLQHALQDIYPEYRWIPWKFHQVEDGFWDSAANRRAYFEYLSNEYGFKSMDEWYNVKKEKFMKEKSSAVVLGYYADSIARALTDLFPEHEWHLWCFESVPRGFWHHSENQKQFLDWFANKFEIRSPEEWSRFNEEDIIAQNGKGLLSQHSGSLLNALLHNYPNFPVWRLSSNVPHGFWNDIKNVRSLVDWLAKKLSIKSLEDWYGVAYVDVEALIGGYLFKKFNGLILLLATVYPDYPWNIKHSTNKSQQFLIRIAKELFPTAHIQTEYRPPGFVYVDTGEKMQFDIYIPSLSLAMEYQGEHHYFPVQHQNHLQTQQRDEEKAKKCQREGITMIIIPYWWDRSKESIKATIHLQRPDLIPHLEPNSVPIPSSPPSKS